MKPKLYLETSVVSYLASHPSRDLIIAANQQITREWWETRRQDFELYISQLVTTEANAGDPTAAQQRMEFLKKFNRRPFSNTSKYSNMGKTRF